MTKGKSKRTPARPKHRTAPKRPVRRPSLTRAVRTLTLALAVSLGLGWAALAASVVVHGLLTAPHAVLPSPAPIAVAPPAQAALAAAPANRGQSASAPCRVTAWRAGERRCAL